MYPTLLQQAQWQEERDAMDGAEQLRAAANLASNQSGTFNEQYTAEQHLQLWRMYRVCGWDIKPEDWTPQQLKTALRGVAPRWDESTEEPL